MKLPYSEPRPSGIVRAEQAKNFRDLATEASRLMPHAITMANFDEVDFEAPFPANFTKGLYHNQFGLVEFPEDYVCFVEAINSEDGDKFGYQLQNAESRASTTGSPTYRTYQLGQNNSPVEPSWRGWESPRSGHVFDLQGPDAGAVGMAPAPRIGSSEAAFELAEVYALALLRDFPFTSITGAKGPAAPIVSALAGMPFITGAGVTSSSGGTVLNGYEKNRRNARIQSGVLTPKNAFRGSTPGSFAGPYLSQFLLIGTAPVGGDSTTSAAEESGEIQYGTLSVNQRSRVHKAGIDYMTDWDAWLDVQNGADQRGQDQYEDKPRFLMTPRDLATYVHFDALYEAYLNAALILNARGVPASKGFPEPDFSGRRTPFATFGGPHILSLVTEVATRCLKAVRRQKFNYHRRCRPEALGGRITLLNSPFGSKLEDSLSSFSDLSSEIPAVIKAGIHAHNLAQNQSGLRTSLSSPANTTEVSYIQNLLLPMAFPEGSPMHPAYGAGHATVAGGCVTILKAFFEMFTDSSSHDERPLFDSNCKKAYVANAANNGSTLIQDAENTDVLTIQGELDKLAANISIGRNMAGVHYYSDYYDSLRLGERIALGLLMDQAPSYLDPIQTTFTSFDGDHVVLQGSATKRASLSFTDRNGDQVSLRDWWLRHVPGEEMTQDRTI